MIRTLSPNFKGGSLSIFELSFFDLFFLISAAWAFQSLCSSWTEVVMFPWLKMVFPRFSSFHSGLLHSLPKWSRNVECALEALGNVL